jgi:hypothetical protein
MEAPVGLLVRFPVEMRNLTVGFDRMSIVVDGTILVGQHIGFANLSRVVVGWRNGGLSAAVDGYVLGCELHEEQYMTVPGGKICLLWWRYFGQD